MTTMSMRCAGARRRSRVVAVSARRDLAPLTPHPHSHPTPRVPAQLGNPIRLTSLDHRQTNDTPLPSQDGALQPGRRAPSAATFFARPPHAPAPFALPLSTLSVARHVSSA